MAEMLGGHAGVVRRFFSYLFGGGGGQARESGIGQRLSEAWTPISGLFLLGAIVLTVSVLALSVAVDASELTRKGSFWLVAGLSIQFVLAAAIVGIAVGFLFAVPRVATNGRPAPIKAADDKEGSESAVSSSLLESNSNLERISDWLTSAIVALSLANFNEIGRMLAGLGVTAQNSLCTLACVDGVAGDGLGVFGASTQALVIFGSAWGFLLGYLHTRIFIGVLFNDALLALRPSGPPPTEAEIQLAVRRMLETSAGRTQLSPAMVKEMDTIARREPARETDPDRAILSAETKLALGFIPAAISAVNFIRQKWPTREDILRRANYVESRATETEGPVPVYEMFKALYESPPDGFERAIRIGEAVLARGIRPRDPQFWINLASGYGQRHAWLTQATVDGLNVSGSEAAVSDARRNALEAVKTTLELGPEWKGRLQQLWSPTLTNKKSEDDDLESFYDDPDFQEILGLNK